MSSRMTHDCVRGQTQNAWTTRYISLVVCVCVRASRVRFIYQTCKRFIQSESFARCLQTFRNDLFCRHMCAPRGGTTQDFIAMYSLPGNTAWLSLALTVIAHCCSAVPLGPCFGISFRIGVGEGIMRLMINDFRCMLPVLHMSQFHCLNFLITVLCLEQPSQHIC